MQRLLSFTLLFLSLITFLSCDTRSLVVTLDEAHQKFVEYCLEDGLTVHLTPLTNTLYIYVPLEFSLLNVKADGYGIALSDVRKEDPSLKFIDTKIEEGSINVRYDINNSVSYDKIMGYAMGYHQNFGTIHKAIYNNIYRTYIELDQIPGERTFVDPGREEKRNRLIEGYLDRVEVPEFFVIVFADITNGIEMKITFAFDDYKKEVTQAIAMEESVVRRITEVSGNKDAIGNKTGDYFEKKEITWPEFLAKQITQRITFAYGEQTSKAKPQSPEEYILESIAKTIKIYNFEQFESVIIHDLSNDQPKTLKKSIFDDYDITEIEPRGTIHRLEFDATGRIVEDIVK